MDLIWPLRNRTKKNMVSYWSDGTPFIIKPGERIFIPKQWEFINSMYDYNAVLYGGAAGSGKSYILLWSLILILRKLAGQGIKNPRVVLFNQTYNDAIDRHINELPNYFPTWLGTIYESKPPEFHLCDEWGGGAILFRNLQKPDQYKSVQFGAIAFDEITENEEHIFDTILLRKRFPGVTHIPVLAATNPTGPGRSWVHRKFVDPTTREQAGVNNEILDVNGEPFKYKGFHFIKALPTDNPTLTPDYLDELSRKPEKIRKAYFEGSWEAFEGQFFDLIQELHQFDGEMEIDEGWRFYRAIDAGYGHPTVCLWGAVDYDGDLWIFREYSVTGHDAVYHKKHIAEMSSEDKYVRTVGDPKMWGGDHSVSTNKTWREVFNNDKDGVGSFNMVKAKASLREQRWDAMITAFGYDFEWQHHEDGTKSRKVNRFPNVRISTNCPLTWKSLTSRSHDDKNPDVIKKSQGLYKPGEGDDETDTLSYMLMSVSGKFGTAEKSPSYERQFARNRTYAPNTLNKSKSIWSQG